MAKFNIEVELDWMDEEAYSIDDELRERIVKGVENALLEKATNEAVKAVDNKIAEKILEAEETIQANLAKDTIERMNIPEVLKKLSSIGAKQVTGTSLPE